MTVIYKAPTEIAINVRFGGRTRHLAFTPLSEGGSLYTTGDTALQKAIEAHPRYGRLFKCITPRQKGK